MPPDDPPPPDPAAELLLAFTRLSRDHRGGGAMPGRLEALARDGSLGPRHFRALAVIALGGTLTVSELARREGCALSTASLVVTQLAEAGLVERSEDPDDRRRTVVCIAPEHRRATEQVVRARLAPLRRALRRLGPEGSAALMTGLSVVADEIAGVHEAIDMAGAARRPAVRGVSRA